MNNGEPDPADGALGSFRSDPCDCPSAEVLDAFAGDFLLPEEAEAVRAHVARCGVCDSLVERLRSFDEGTAGDPPGWPAAERRLRSRVNPKVKAPILLTRPVLAWGVALAAVLIAIGVSLRQSPRATPVATAPPLESVRTLDLYTTRGDVAPRFVLDPADKYLILSFLIDTRPALRYMASLDGGAPREIASTDGKGNFAILCGRELLGRPGEHRLVVTEMESGTGRTERSFEFSFQL